MWAIHKGPRQTDTCLMVGALDFHYPSLKTENKQNNQRGGTAVCECVSVLGKKVGE